MPLKLFVSYSHQDQAQLDKLLEGLRPLEREGLIEPWTDRLIDVGEDWRADIKTALEDCELGIFLLSLPFLGSDFIDAKELKPLLTRAKSNDVRLVPVLLRSCDWTNTALGNLQPLPGWDQYIETSGVDEAARDEAWTRVVTKIRRWASESDDEKEVAVWNASPYPGLRAFDEREAPIFTGRRDETEALLDKLEQGVRFLAVFGASGSGKSSLVRAGLIPAWRQRLAGGETTPVLVTKPDELGDHDPFLPLSIALQPFLPPGADIARLKQILRDDPGSIGRYIDSTLHGLSDATEFLLLVDQFEELFTTVEASQRQPFASLLGRVLAHPRARLVITVRSDFFHCFEDYPELAVWLNQGNGQFLVRPLEPEHYRTLIEGPARLAGFRFEAGLVERVLAEARPGASREGLVPLLEFALAKLYQPFAERLARGEALPGEARCFTAEAYQAFGSIKGAVAAAANDAVAEVEDATEALPSLFRELVNMSAEMKPTRRRAPRRTLERDPVCADLMQRLIGDRDHARLLVATEEHVEVAHEVLFTAWQAMADWIAEFRNDLHMRDRMILEARQWDQGDRSDRHLLWSHERQQPLYKSLERLGRPRDDWPKEPEKSFLRPEEERLLDEITELFTDHQRRDWIGARWAAIGDPRPGLGLDQKTRLPDILWSKEVQPGTVELEDGAGRFEINYPSRVSVYPVTRDQYTAFLDAAADGYDNDNWWRDLTRPEPRWPPTGAGGNYPVGLVSWHEAVAYCRWLDYRLREHGGVASGQQIRLPTEWEWQLAATAGDRQREYPWPGPWDAAKLNCVESGLMRTMAAGLYPAGAAPCGALDMVGNNWEWCLNKYEKAGEVAIGGEDTRVLRGGSWFDIQDYCRAAYRYGLNPYNRNYDFGFRLCLSSPIVDD